MSFVSELENRFVARFSSPRKLLSGGELQDGGSASLTAQLVIGRDYCRYLGMELGHVPKSQRNQALKSQLLAYSMWDNVDYCVAWQGSFAQLWFWNADKVSEQVEHLGEAGTGALRNLRKVWMLAEATLWDKPAESGLLIAECRTGYDLQYWQQGRLLASQWFSNEPGMQEVRRFSRSQGVEQQQEMPEVVRPQENETPWQGVMRPDHVGSDSLPRKLAFGGAALFAVILLLQVIGVIRWSVLENRYDSLREELEASSVSVLEARSMARQLRDDYEDTVALFSVPDSLYSQWQVVQRLPQELDLSLIRWERNVNEVELTVGGEIQETLTLVQQLGEAESIREASIEDSRVDGQYVFRLTLEELPRTAGVLSANNRQENNNADNGSESRTSSSGANSTNSQPAEPIPAEEITPEMFEEMFGVPL